MATKKGATKKGAASKKAGRKRTGNHSEAAGLKTSESIVDGKSPIIGGVTPNIALEYILPPDMQTLYVDNVNIVHTQSEFIISFLQTQHPLIRGDEDWDNVKSIPSRCVARIAVSPMKMQLVVNTLFTNWQRYYTKFIEPVESEVGNAARVNDQTDSDGE
jgi:hypothetical protein